MKLFQLNYAATPLGFLIVPKAFEEQDLFLEGMKELIWASPLSIRDLDATKMCLGGKSFQEWEDEYYGSKEHNSKM